MAHSEIVKVLIIKGIGSALGIWTEIRFFGQIAH